MSRTQTPIASVLATRLREAQQRGDYLAEALQCGAEMIQRDHEVLARAGIAVALGVGAVEVAREILDVLKAWARLERVAERLADRAAAAEARLDAARAALPALVELARKGSPQAREAVAKMAAALGETGERKAVAA